MRSHLLFLGTASATALSLAMLTLIPAAVAGDGTGPGQGAVSSTAANDGAADDGSCTMETPVITPLPDGGQKYTYAGDGTSPVSTEVPPAGFSPLSASDQELEEYGFPMRPSDPSEAVSWNEAMTDYTSTPVPGTICWQSGEPATPDTDPEGNSSGFSGNWDGYVDTPASGNTFTAVSGEYHQPSRGGTSCSNEHESAWVGLGGWADRADGSRGLLQDGTAYDTSGSPYAWYEYVGKTASGAGTGVVEQNFAEAVDVEPGDHIYAYTSYDKSSGVATFVVEDETTGQEGSQQVGSMQSYYEGTNAEWIIERPSRKVSGVDTPWPLQNFGSISWTYAQVYNNAWINAGNTSAQNKVNMTRDGTSTGQVLATTAALNSAGTDFTSNFYHCGGSGY